MLGGIDRLKGWVFNQAEDFAIAMNNILACDISSLTQEDAYKVLCDDFLRIKGQELIC